MKKKIKEYTPSKFLYIILFLLPVLYIITYTKSLDNDIWYLLSEGRYIVNHGIYHIDPLSMHKGLEVTVQNWASASLFYLIFKLFGEYGIFCTILICDIAISYLLYKICTLISDNNKLLSLICAFVTNLLLVFNYMVSRPQIFSFILLLGVIYVLELYVKTEDKKYLRWLPILSIIEANIHGSLWFMIFLFALPYIIDGIKCKTLKFQGYKLKPLLIYLGIAFVCGLINPYGYKMITFIFTSFTDTYMHKFILELFPLGFNSTLGKMIFCLGLFVMLCYAYFKEGKIRVRYLCLFSGTLILGVSTLKACSHFILVSIFPLAYFFKDIFPKDFGDLIEIIKPLRKVFLALSILLIACIGYSFYLIGPRLKLDSDIGDCVQAIKDTYGNDAIVFSTFNHGGTVEYYGLKPYIDPRAEVFLKINNKKDDIFKEFFDFYNNDIKLSKLLEKYHFTHAIVDVTSSYYQKFIDEDFIVIYIPDATVEGDTSVESNFRALASKDILSEEEIEYYSTLNKKDITE